MFICLKSSNIEGNLGRSASYLISVDRVFFIGGAGGALPPLKLVQIWYMY